MCDDAQANSKSREESPFSRMACALKNSAGAHERGSESGVRGWGIKWGTGIFDSEILLRYQSPTTPVQLRPWASNRSTIFPMKSPAAMYFSAASNCSNGKVRSITGWSWWDAMKASIFCRSARDPTKMP
jgi:hypothetical protein